MPTFLAPKSNTAGSTDRQRSGPLAVSGTTVGLPELRGGSNVLIKGVGSRLSGTYFVTQTEHVINDSGYITKFQARREHFPEADA